MKKTNYAFLKNIAKKSGSYILYNSIVVSAIFLLIEFSLNFLLNHPSLIPDQYFSSFKKYYSDYDRTIIQSDPEFAQFDMRLCYKLRPGKFTFSNREFSNDYFVNTMGIRDDEASLNKPEIIMLGDSHTMGWGVDQDSTFAQRVEKISGKKVLNTGISSYGTARELRLLKSLDNTNLKYLIIQYSENDYIENKTHYTDGNNLIVNDEKGYNFVCERHKIITGYHLFKHLTTLTDLIKNDTSAEPVVQEKTDSSEVNPFFAFLNIIVTSPKIPVNTKIIVFSIDSGKSDDYFIKGVQQKLKDEQFNVLEKRITFIDFTSKLNKDHFYILDDHMNDTGHRIVAAEILKYVD